MSEKRLASSGDSFVDLTEMQTVDLLNKLSDENTRLHKKVDEQQATIERLVRKLKKYAKIGEGQLKQIIELQEETKRLEKMIWKIQWRFQQEVGIEKAREHYREIDKEMQE